MNHFEPALRTLDNLQPMRLMGRVVSLRGITVLVQDLPLPVGSLVRLGELDVPGEVVGFTGQQAIVMTLGTMVGIRPGERVVGLQAAQTVGVGDSLLGRCLDGLGRPIDGKGVLRDTRPRALDPAPIAPLARVGISRPLHTGIRAIDLMTPMGRGQRMGIFAGPGVGKSTLLADIARGTDAEIVVLGLIGERGREVRDFVDKVLGEDRMGRCVVVASTSDESPLMRLRAAMTACTVAEHFRAEGRQVMLMLDSITRFAQAQRQVGLSAGEPPATKGYTPSVFSSMARLLERAGQVTSERGGTGSITGLYTVLVEGDDMSEPIADAARGILDGHIALSRGIAQRGQFPAIDVLDSVSRVANDVSDAAHLSARRQVIGLLAEYRKIEDLLQIGAYAKGANPLADLAIAFHPRILELLKQESGSFEPFEAARSRLVKLALEAGHSGQGGKRGQAA